MADDWRDNGYVLGEQGGPFSILYEPLQQRSLKVCALEDPYGRSDYGFLPYEMILLNNSAWLVTLVTPDSESDFSKGLANSLSAALLGTTI